MGTLHGKLPFSLMFILIVLELVGLAVATVSNNMLCQSQSDSISSVMSCYIQLMMFCPQ